MKWWPFGKKKSMLLPAGSERGWMRIFESYAGAFQQDVTVDPAKVSQYYAVFACRTLIASDISKLRIKVVALSNGIWIEVANKDFAVLDRPNGYQNRIQFLESWLLSKLSYGNAYILKVRDRRGKVVELYVLSAERVTPLVSDHGEVFYRLQNDNLSGLTEQVIVPASEIIHDRFNCLHHPLVGLPPIYACGAAAMQGLAIQNNSTSFFNNMSRPSGILTSPDTITPEAAKEIKERWEENFGAGKVGRTAILGNQMKYEALAVTAVDAELIEQYKMTAEVVCSAHHVPKYMVMGDPPSYNNIESLGQQYYSQCLQSPIEALELLLDEGLDMPAEIGLEFDLDGLFRMDSKTRVETLGTAVSKTIMTPNEARRKMNLAPVAGGDALYLQQQNYSLDALARRDAKDDPFGKETAVPALPAPQEDQTEKALAYLKAASPENLFNA